MLIALYFILLLFFGKTFTKLNIGGIIYLHDLSLLAILFLCLLIRPHLRLHFTAIPIMLAISILYFLISLYLHRSDGFLALTIRQYALFLYLCCGYLIFCNQVQSKNEIYSAIGLIRVIAHLSLYAQIFYLIYGYATIPGFSLFQPKDYNYFSPLTIMGIIVYCADVISNNQNFLLKIFKFTLGIAVALTLGHSSAFLAVFIILMLYAYIRIKPLQRIFSFVFIILAVGSLLFLPQFTDFNASWRLLYWKHILVRAVRDGYLLLGHGFGEAYMTADYSVYLDKAIHSRAMIEEYYPLARHINPPHNSFLSIVFHIGFVPALLFLVPMKRYFKQLFFKKFPEDRNTMFVILALSGCLIWISFNVILELPHSATYFWLVYFTAIFYLKNNTPSIEQTQQT